ncbi:MAG: hypothetical protein WAL90_20515 [Desulfobacterales bacterium]
MQKKDVPQDIGLNRGQSEITYAVDEDGKYVQAPSLGWEPKNIVNQQAWEQIRREIAAEIEQVRAGKRSPLAYHMATNLMDVGLLAGYAGLSRWRVRRHLKPAGFRRLDHGLLERYADIFGISCEALQTIPDLSESQAHAD